jgi:hypothetical protein
MAIDKPIKLQRGQSQNDLEAGNVGNMTTIQYSLERLRDAGANYGNKKSITPSLLTF